jgi:hypothetical protein
LSALEIYRAEHFIERPNVKGETKRLCGEIELLKKGEQLKLEDNSQENRKQFFKWFEEEFFRVYTVVEDKQ